MGRHTQGVVLFVLSAIAYSSAGFFTRLIHLNAWTMLFWRGLFAGLMILCIIVVQQRRRTIAAIRAVGSPGILAAVCSARRNDPLLECVPPHLCRRNRAGSVLGVTAGTGGSARRGGGGWSHAPTS